MLITTQENISAQQIKYVTKEIILESMLFQSKMDQGSQILYGSCEMVLWTKVL